MITVLKAETTKKQRDKLIEWFESQGLKVHISEGEFQTVLGLVGDTSKIDEELVESLEMVESVKRISEPFNINFYYISIFNGSNWTVRHCFR